MRADMEIYDFLRLGLLTLIISLMSVLVKLLTQKNESSQVTGFTVMIISAISIIVSAIILNVIGYVADELGISGDVVSFNMFFIIVGLSMFNYYVYIKKNKVSSS
jgi:hypothetical protein